jgi:hypothetical protein
VALRTRMNSAALLWSRAHPLAPARGSPRRSAPEPGGARRRATLAGAGRTSEDGVG